jgi:transposase
MTQPSQPTESTNRKEMPFSAEEWYQTPPAVQEFVLSLLARVEALEAEVVELREQLNRNSSNSSQPPSSDGPDVASKPDRQAKQNRQRGGQPGHKGVNRKLVPVEQVKKSYDLKADQCRQCGQQLVGTDPDPYRHQVTDIPPVVAEVSEYRLHTLTCSECGTETRAELPTGVPNSAFGPRLQAMVALLSGRYHLSKRDVAEVMSDFFQADLSLGSVPTLEQRTSQALQEPVNEARQYVKQQAVVHLDETGWFEGHHRAWVWVAATSWVTVFVIRPSRGGQVVRELLTTAFCGIVNSDRWSAYNWLLTLLRQLCWAHLRRDFQAFLERGGSSQLLGQALLAQVDLMFKWWYRVRDGTMPRLTFQEKMQPLQHNVGQLLRLGAACSHPKTAATCRNILKREAALWTFVRVDGVEPTNNLAERQIRPAVLWRKRSFGTQSQAGSRFAERIMTVVASLKQQHRNVLDYLTEACEAAHWGQPAPSLLPDPIVMPDQGVIR